jgi:hypothetical protein
LHTQRKEYRFATWKIQSFITYEETSHSRFILERKCVQERTREKAELRRVYMPFISIVCDYWVWTGHRCNRETHVNTTTMHNSSQSQHNLECQLVGTINNLIFQHQKPKLTFKYRTLITNDVITCCFVLYILLKIKLVPFIWDSKQHHYMYSHCTDTMENSLPLAVRKRRSLLPVVLACYTSRFYLAMWGKDLFSVRHTDRNTGKLFPHNNTIATNLPSTQQNKTCTERVTSQKFNN